MSTLITKNLRILLAKQFYNLLNLSANDYLPSDRISRIYAVMGKQLPWNSGVESVPAPYETDQYLNDVFKNGIIAKYLSIENSSYVVPRIDWASNTAYNTYLSNTNFYIKNSNDQVFKCLANNSGVVSTDEPAVTISTTSLEEPYIKTSDGYKWKYMYTINSQQKQKFMSEDWMPVATNKFVSAAAIGGSIDIVSITNSGNNYVTGSLQNIITINGDGTGAILKANVSASGNVTDIIIQNRGQGYTYADLTFTDVTGGSGAGAAAQVSISPHDGHGFDPVYELDASNILFNIEYNTDETGSLTTDNDFRQIFLVYNPYTYGTTTLANSSLYTLYTKIKVSPGVGNFSVDEIVYQGDTYSGATFTADVISFDSVANQLYLNNVKGTIQNNASIKGLSSGSIRIINSYTNPTLDLYSGKVLYVANKLPITRDPAQTERIRFILSF